MHISLNMKVSLLTWIIIQQKCLSINHTIHQHLFSNISPFHSLIKEKGKPWRMKGLTMVQYINFNQNNRSVLAFWYSVLWEKVYAILPQLVDLRGRQAGGWVGGWAGGWVGGWAGGLAGKQTGWPGRQAYEIIMGGPRNFKILYWLNYLAFILFNITAMLLQTHNY